MTNKYLEKIAEREYTDKEIARKHTFSGMSDKTLREHESLDDFYHVSKPQGTHGAVGAGIGVISGAALGALIGHHVGRGHPLGALAGGYLGSLGAGVGGGVAGSYHGALKGVRERIDHGHLPKIKNTSK
jgi:hypothetical protein